METLTPQQAEKRGYKSITVGIWEDEIIASIERDMSGCNAVWVFFKATTPDERDSVQCFRKKNELKSSK